MDESKCLVETLGICRVMLQLQESLDESVKLFIGLIKIEPQIVAHLIGWQVAGEIVVAHGRTADWLGLERLLVQENRLLLEIAKQVIDAVGWADDQVAAGSKGVDQVADRPLL